MAMNLTIFNLLHVSITPRFEFLVQYSIIMYRFESQICIKFGVDVLFLFKAKIAGLQDCPSKYFFHEPIFFP